MGAKAFILIETVRGRSMEVDSALKHLGGVRSANPVTPPYDIIVVAEGETLSEIESMVNLRIQSIAGVTRTVTCPTIAPS